MKVLVLGGTGWLGREVAAQAVAGGHQVTCLARGRSGPVAPGSRLVAADRAAPGAYARLAGEDWDSVVEVSWQPGLVAGALAALAGRVGHYTYVSSLNVYADQGADHGLGRSCGAAGGQESAPLLAPTALAEVEPEQYGAAKVACELAAAEALRTGGVGALLVARAGLIGVPGDHSGRSGAWVARAARDPDAPMLVPDTPRLATQVIDVRDLAGWLLRAAAASVAGTVDTVGPVVDFGEWVALCREVAGHTGPVVAAPADWLLAQQVEQFMGPDSLAMWLVEPGWEGWATRSGAAALAAGLTHRPRRDLLTDLLAWERGEGLGRERKAGLSEARERGLLAALACRH